MSQPVNMYAARITPKQKEELLGIYEDYLYFERGLEFMLNNSSASELSYMRVTNMHWETVEEKNVPWNIKTTSHAEREAYIKFANGQDEEGDKYSYISLYHINEEEDVDLPKVKYCSDKYSETTIDLNLPCPVERYDVAYVNDQKMKDAILLIDGKFNVRYTGSRYKDVSVGDALNNPKMQEEFRIMLRLADYYDKNRYSLERKYTYKELYAHFGKVMTKVIATEALAEYENKVLDLLGMYASKAQEVVRGLFPDKKSAEAWKAAEEEGLISSAENMRHYLNIRHLLRHQWDTLDNLGNFSPGNSKEHKDVRKEYIKSYRIFFDKTFHERIKEYQKVSRNMQTLLQVACPDFLARKEQESNSKFVQRLKEWQKENPDANMVVNVNYPLSSDKYTSLLKNISKVLPQAKVSDCFRKENYTANNDREKGYSDKTWYLGLYNHIETDMMTYCWTRGIDYTRNNTWYYFRNNILSREEYDTWCKFRLLRNNLSHNHLDAKLRADLASATEGSFGQYIIKMANFLRQNTPKFTKQPDGTFLAVHNDGLRVVVDMEKMTVLSCKDKDGNDVVNNKTNVGNKNSENNVKSNNSVKVRWWDGEIADCRFSDGIYIDVRKQKVCFPDGTQMHFNTEDHNYFYLGSNKMFTDKAFEITKFYERGKYRDIGKNEDRVIALGHRIRTDSKRRIKEDVITLADGKKLNIKFRYDLGKAMITLPNGTELNVSKGKFALSHNGIELNYENRYNFKNSYGNHSSPFTMQKSSFER